MNENEQQTVHRRLVILTVLLAAVCVGATIFRVVLADWAGMRYYTREMYDDVLLVEYADFSSYYQNALGMRLSLLKEMSFPLFLNLVHRSGISILRAMSLLWIVTALITSATIRNVLGKGHQIVLMLVYLFVLYTPCAFDAWLGVRFYRNIILAPFYLMVFDLLIMSVFNALDTRRRAVGYALVIGVFEGLLLLFTYYIKEDGIWLAACTAFVLLVDFFIYLVSVLKKQRKLSAAILSFCFLLLIPTILFAGNQQYKEWNRQHFGVSLTNARTSGELGRFVKNLYRIDAKGKTVQVWATADSLDQAYAASPTLASDEVVKALVYGDANPESSIRAVPVTGDFYGWRYKDAFVDSGHFPDYVSVQEFLAQVNTELEAAFQNGTLKKDRDRIQLVGSMGGRTPEELVDLLRQIPLCYKIHIGLQGYKYAADRNYGSDFYVPDTVGLASEIANYDFTKTDGAPIEEFDPFIRAEGFVKVIFVIYRIFQIALMLLAFGCVLYGIIRIPVRLCKKESLVPMDMAVLGSAIVIFGFSLAYSIAITWFNGSIASRDFLVAAKFYSVGLVPLLMLFELLGVCLLIRFKK